MFQINEITNTDTIEWLLEKNNYSVRYFTLKHLLKKPRDDKEVIEAKQSIMNDMTVQRILNRQTENGYWGEAGRFYLEKYYGSVWQLLILAEYGCDAENDKIKKACEFILENSQDIESYGFSINKSGKSNGGRHSEVIPCLTGNMVWSLMRLGYGRDERVQNGINWICQYQRCDDGNSEAAKEWPYNRYEMCWGKHSCHMGVVKSLKALSEIPVEQRSDLVEKKIRDLAEYVLIHHIYKKSHNLKSISKPGWLKFGFPLMYQTDILEILAILTDLGYSDSRMSSALEIVRQKQTKEGRWKLENTFNGKMITNIEVKGADSKWITYRALKVLMNS